jgi:hypothetical protein
VCSQPPAILPISFTGGSSSRPRRDQRGRSATRKWNFRFASEGTFEDEYLDRQAEEMAAQEAAHAKVLLGDDARKELWRVVDVGAVSPCAW